LRSLPNLRPGTANDWDEDSPGWQQPRRRTFESG
jgi:hypothetical protein